METGASFCASSDGKQDTAEQRGWKGHPLRVVLAVCITAIIALVIVVTVLCTMTITWHRPQGGRPVPRSEQPPDLGGHKAITITPTTPPPSKTHQLYYIAPYHLIVMMHGPSSQPGRHTPLYDKTPEYRFGFVVAGTESLAITGGGTNGATAKMLVDMSGGTLSAGQLEGLTREVHLSIFDQAHRSPGNLVELDVHNMSPIYESVYAYRATNPGPSKAVNKVVGTLIIGLLKPAFYPHGNPKNKYLLYIVAPKGSVPDPEFHTAYVHMWTSLVAGVQGFNEHCVLTGGEPIEQLRIPLLSGGIYAAGRDPRMLAKIAVDTVLPYVAAQLSFLQLDFMYDDTHSFFDGVKNHLPNLHPSGAQAS